MGTSGSYGGGDGGSNNGSTTSGGRPGDPPNLANIPSEPIYDLQTIVGRMQMRPLILWGWERQLGIPAPKRVQDEAGSMIARYSERDLVATLWLREQVVNGEEIKVAADRLRRAQVVSIPEYHVYVGEDPPPSGSLGSSGIYGSSTHEGRSRAANTGPLRNSTFGAPQPGSSTRQLNGDGATWDGMPPRRGAPSGPLRAPTNTGALGGPLQPYNTNSYAGPASISPSGPPSMPGTQISYGARADNSGRLVTGPAGAPISTWPKEPVQRPHNPSQPLGTRSSTWGDVPIIGQHPGPSGVWATPPARTSDLNSLAPLLVKAFGNLDTATANRVIAEAMQGRTIENVCIGLIQPALARVNELWSRRDMTLYEDRFATMYVRSLLSTFFQTSPERADAPEVFIGCGPRELNEMHAMMLAVFFRRAGLRVVYLGPNLEDASLMEEIRIRRPAVVTLSIATTQRLRSLARFARQVSQLDAPRPIMTFGGPVFAHNPDLCSKVIGVYLGDDAAVSTYHIKNLLGMPASAAPPMSAS